MAISPVTVSTDYQGMQTDSHGTAEFPVACFDENMNRDVCVWHWHDSFEIILVTGGSVSVRIGREALSLGAGQGIFINVRQLHICQQGAGLVSTFHSIVFSPSAAGDVGTIFWQKYIRPVMSGNAAYVTFSREKLQTDSEEDSSLYFHASSAWQAEAAEPGLYEIKVRYHLTCFLALIAEKLQSHPASSSMKPSSERDLRDVRRVRSMLRYIENHYQEPITLAEIAQSASLSEGECIRCFQRSIHTSPLQYTKRYRILRAKEFLLEPDVSISEVAERCGYQDPGYFIRCFTRLTGTTPGAYRKASSAVRI